MHQHNDLKYCGETHRYRIRSGSGPTIITAKRIGGLGGGLAVIKLKGCPKCQGDLYLTEDMFGKYYSCMQCGYLKDIIEPRLTSIPKVDAVREAELEAA